MLIHRFCWHKARCAGLYGLVCLGSIATDQLAHVATSYIKHVEDKDHSTSRFASNTRSGSIQGEGEYPGGGGVEVGKERAVVLTDFLPQFFFFLFCTLWMEQTSQLIIL